MKRVKLRHFLSVIAALLIGFLAFHIFRNPDLRSESFARAHQLVSAARIKNQTAELASKPHRAGTRENTQVGDKIIERLKNAGFEVIVDELNFDLPVLGEVRLELIEPERREFRLKEKQFSKDPFSKIAEEEIPFFAYSPDADLEADIIFANFGSREDYAFLKRSGINPEGKIALVRGRGICRSMKVSIAADEKVTGLLIYPELRDQGIIKPAFPDGPHLNSSVIQRGSLLKYFLMPGDPIEASKSGINTEPRLPALPISPEIAKAILLNLSGPEVPEDWQGWLLPSYHTGPGTARVKMSIKSKREPSRLRNIQATLRGRSGSAGDVIVGNHYDAWVYGASDPGSATAVVLEAAETLITLQKEGWKPDRNIVFSFWDGEEYGMLGSTAWFLRNAQFASNVSAYLNIDTAYRANDFAAFVMPGLREVVDRSLQGINDPLSGQDLFELRGEYAHPGFSSDANPFMLFTGIPIAEIGFGRSYSLYHSLYDNLTWLEIFGDPDAKYRQALALITVKFLYQFSGEEIIPYHFAELAEGAHKTIKGWKEQFKTEIDSSMISKLKDQIDKFESTANRFDQQRVRIRNFREKDRINAILMDVFKSFYESGRGHLLYKPSQSKGCAGDALPGVYNSLLSGDRQKARKEIADLMAAFSRSTKHLEEAERILKNNPKKSE